MPRKARTESLADMDAAPGGVAAVDRALSLLACFVTGDAALSLSELAQRSKLYKSTAMRLIASLEHARMLQRLDDGRYSLGSEIARLNGIHTASFSLDSVVLPVLRKLVDLTGESAAYHVRQGTTRLCLYRVDSPQPIRDHIKAGDVLPLDRGSGGRVLTTFDPELLKTASAKDRKMYELVRTQGYSAGKGDRLPGVAGISAPVFRSDGTLAAALTLSMPDHRYDKRFITAVVQCAQFLGNKL